MKAAAARRAAAEALGTFFLVLIGPGAVMVNAPHARAGPRPPPPELLVAKVHEKFDAGLRLKDEGTRKLLGDLLVRFSRWIGRERAAAQAEREPLGARTGDLAEIRARSWGHPDTRSPAPTSTRAPSATCHHGAASCCGELIGPVRASRGGIARRNHRDGLPG
jgi:hypothetical protein